MGGWDEADGRPTYVNLSGSMDLSFQFKWPVLGNITTCFDDVVAETKS